MAVCVAIVEVLNSFGMWSPHQASELFKGTMSQEQLKLEEARFRLKRFQHAFRRSDFSPKLIFDETTHSQKPMYINTGGRGRN